MEGGRGVIRDENETRHIITSRIGPSGVHVTHLHDAVSREIGGSTYFFNIVIDMEGRGLNNLIAEEIGLNMYPNYIELQGQEIVGKRGVLIENIHSNDNLNGRLRLKDIDNNDCVYPFVSGPTRRREEEEIFWTLT